MIRFNFGICIILACIMGCGQNEQLTLQNLSSVETPGVIYKDGPVKGRMIEAGFYEGDSTFNGVMQASDGNVYYVILRSLY